MVGKCNNTVEAHGNCVCAHLEVQVQMVKLPVGPERLRVVVQCEVHVPANPLDDDRVPVVIVQ